MPKHRGVFAPLSHSALMQPFILDGHNRYAICVTHDIDLVFAPFPIEFESLSEAKVWMIRNQFNRRNINSFVRAELALLLKCELAEQGKENMAFGLQRNLNEGLTTLTNHNSREEISKAASVSEGSIHKVEKILQSGDKDLIESCRHGGTSINAAYTTTKRVETEVRNEELKKKPVMFPKGKYQTIVIDPPWEMQKIEADIIALWFYCFRVFHKTCFVASCLGNHLLPVQRFQFLKRSYHHEVF